MQQGKWILGALLASALGANATAATATSASKMAECGLDFSAAIAEMKKLPVLSTDHVADIDYSQVITELDPASVRPYGLAANKLSYSDYEDDVVATHVLTTTLLHPYDSVRALAFKQFGMVQCITETGGGGDFRFCKTLERKEPGGRLMSAKLIEWTGGTRVECAYTD